MSSNQMANVDNLHAVARRAEPTEIEARFQALVQSPLRAAILRFLCARPDESFDVEALMQTFGRMRLDVDNCVRELVTFGIVRRTAGPGSPKYGFVQPDSDALRDLLDTFLERRATVSHEDRSPAVQRFREMIGRDEKMLVIFEWIRTAAKSDISVLILGPTGSGKEVVARMIHELSRRGTHKFQAVNCAALPDTLFESEIFGYEKGAFTGAHDRKPGRLELANNGTLFLDEIGDLSIVAQAKLLRVLEERRFERLGGNTSIEVNFRLISATNRPLDQFVRDSRFREDLYYRVNAFSIRLPSLRERATDIPVLAQRFLARYCAANGLQLDGKSFSKEGLDLLMQYHWRGNIRELESTVSRAALSSAGRVIKPTDIEFLHASEAPVEATRERMPTLAEAERAHIVRVLDSVNWNKKQAASVLDISRGTLYRKIVDYGLQAEPKSTRVRTRPAAE
jgi:two-component system response regulator AtoC